MKYRRYKQEQEKATAEVSCFGGEGKALEYHIMLHAEADGRSYAEQLTAWHAGYAAPGAIAGRPDAGVPALFPE